jgi:hypothetical protein
MKIFFATEMMDFSISVKILKDNGEFIILTGERDDQHMPNFGVKLKDGEQERLTEWVNRLSISEQQKKLIDAKLKSDKESFV